MPHSLHSDRQDRTSGFQPTIDRVNALLDCFDVDALESIWNPVPILKAPESVPSFVEERSTTDAERASEEERERAVAHAFSSRYLLPLFDPPGDSPLPIDPAVAGRLEASYCREHKIAPLAEQGQTLEVAIAFPEALQLADDFQRRYGKQFRPLFAPQSVIERILQLLYADDAKPNSAVAERPEQIENRPPVAETGQRLVQVLLAAALKRQATAIHLDRIGESGRVRFRVDGRLADWKEISSAQITVIQTGLKSRAQLETSATNVSQSGSFQIRAGSNRVPIRLETCPTVDGERAVLHFEDATNGARGLEQCGLDKRQCLEVRSWLSAPPGLILVGSPPSQGTTATLYSLLNETNRPEASLATIESNVERRLDRVQQLQTAEADGLTFADGMRALLNQDLDVIMVGELQDAESLDLCLQACAAGTTVIAGMTARDPLAILRRLFAWTPDRAQLAAELHGVVFQRSLRKLCSHCRKPQTVGRAERQRRGIHFDCPLYQPGGCDHCSGRGYFGRLPLFELFGRNSALLRRLASDGPLERIAMRQSAPESNPRLRAAMRRVIAGETSLAEAERLIGNRSQASIR